MKVIHLAVTAHGGAGIAAARSVQALRECGVDAEFWTDDGSGGARPLRPRHWSGRRIWLDGLPAKLYRNRKLYSAWSNNWLPSRLATRVNRARPDVVHFHWIGGGFISPREFEHISSPIVWTFHDAWALTGGCHYPGDCTRYTAECGNCPQLGSEDPDDLSHRNLRRIRPALRSVAAVVSPSHWLARRAVDSGSVATDRLHVIPYGLDERVYATATCSRFRQERGIAEDDILLAAGAQNLQEPRKGFHLLREALARIAAGTSRRCVLMLFGANSQSFGRDWPGEVLRLGVFDTPAALARVYAAADVLLLPSLQDNFPNQALEAHACGCPVVGFDTGGLAEIIVPGLTGTLARDTTADGLAAAVLTWLATAGRRSVTQENCRARVAREFSLARHGRRLKELYGSIPARRSD